MARSRNCRLKVTRPVGSNPYCAVVDPPARVHLSCVFVCNHGSVWASSTCHLMTIPSYHHGLHCKHPCSRHLRLSGSTHVTRSVTANPMQRGRGCSRGTTQPNPHCRVHCCRAFPVRGCVLSHCRVSLRRRRWKSVDWPYIARCHRPLVYIPTSTSREFPNDLSIISTAIFARWLRNRRETVACCRWFIYLAFPAGYVTMRLSLGYLPTTP